LDYNYLIPKTTKTCIKQEFHEIFAAQAAV